MIYIENNCNDPTYNLAFEEYALMEMDCDEPILLLWQNGPAVIIGKYQNTIEEINYDYIKEHGVSVVRRNTGGGAVYHDLGNLNYSFIIPGVESKVDFGTFTVPVVKALRSQGIDAVQTGRNDILADGKITIMEFMNFAHKHKVQVSLEDLPKYREEARKLGFIK